MLITLLFALKIAAQRVSVYFWSFFFFFLRLSDFGVSERARDSRRGKHFLSSNSYVYTFDKFPSNLANTPEAIKFILYKYFSCLLGRMYEAWGGGRDAEA